MHAKREDLPTYFYMYLGTKYTRLPSFSNVLKMNKPLGILSWDPMASLWGHGGQNLMNSAYEAR